MTTSGHPLLPLSADDVLATTRAVRKRLDLTRPVERSVIEECMRIAQQAPSASNRQHWHFVVVTDPAKRKAIGDLYLKARLASQANRAARTFRNEQQAEVYQRVTTSADYLGERMGDVPVLVIPCIEGRIEQQPFSGQAALWGTILPAAWSFMLAARARGLGDGLDDHPPGVRARSGGDPWHPVRGGDPGGADPAGVHHRDGLQAGSARPAGDDAPLGRLVSGARISRRGSPARYALR